MDPAGTIKSENNVNNCKEARKCHRVILKLGWESPPETVVDCFNLNIPLPLLEGAFTIAETAGTSYAADFVTGLRLGRICSVPVIPCELLLDIFKYLDPVVLLVGIRPISKLFKSLANMIIQQKLFLTSETEVPTTFLRTSKSYDRSVISCLPELSAPIDGDIVTWVGNSEFVAEDSEKIPTRPITICLIPPSSWLWFTPILHFGGGTMCIEDMLHPQTSAEGVYSVNAHSSNTITICDRSWKLRYQLFMDEGNGKRTCRLIIQIPLFALVKRYRIYQEFWVHHQINAARLLR
jgi:hypothetical protein